MTHTVEISDDAWLLFQAHRHECGSPGTDEQEMDELFAISENAWCFFNEKHKAILKRIKERVEQR